MPSTCAGCRHTASEHRRDNTWSPVPQPRVRAHPRKPPAAREVHYVQRSIESDLGHGIRRQRRDGHRRDTRSLPEGLDERSPLVFGAIKNSKLTRWRIEPIPSRGPKVDRRAGRQVNPEQRSADVPQRQLTIVEIIWGFRVFNHAAPCSAYDSAATSTDCKSPRRRHTSGVSPLRRSFEFTKNASFIQSSW